MHFFWQQTIKTMTAGMISMDCQSSAFPTENTESHKNSQGRKNLEEADSLSWLEIGGASSLNLATGNPALDYFSQWVRV